MQNQNKKLMRWILGVALACFLLLLAALLIVKTIFGNNPEILKTYVTVSVWGTMIIYLLFCAIGVVRYNKYAEKYENEKLEKAKKELTAEFKEVLLKYSEPISKDLFKCYAKLDNDGKIVCKIQLDYEAKFENYEDFFRRFSFIQD